MSEINILWADDEIDLLKPHILFLEEKGYKVFTTNSGDEALEYLDYQPIDIVFLDEQMPGLSGLETLSTVKEKFPSLPVVMITKSEEEYIMEDAIGSKISDYLIKPVNPNQILLSIKKNLDVKRLVSEKTTTDYQREFRNLSMRINEDLEEDDWIDVYKKLIHWENELDVSDDDSMGEILAMQKGDANSAFCRFYEENYFDWIGGADYAPLLSHNVFPKKVLPLIEEGSTEPVVVICIDNIRFDQWRAIRPSLSEYYRVEEENVYYSIVPTATSFSRNALFSGLLPTEIEQRFGKQWGSDDDFTSESDLVDGMLALNGKRCKNEFVKVNNLEEGKRLADKIGEYLHNELLVISYNFVDTLTHAKTELDMIKELADNEAAYRSVTSSWFEHSPLLEIMKILSEKGIKVMLTTDHGSIRVKNAVKVIGDKNTNTNLRYKQGKNLDYSSKEVFEVSNTEQAHLPRQNVSTKYIFARGDDFFVYPNNYNHFAKYYKNTFQHGGISMEEVLCPLVLLDPK
ncbi:MAG: two-component system response regulator [Crocinitomicaceae bacterium]|nr:two-component system response regulator [Crocinitomicaceae bacterium]|tara:strand:- start:12569 stop:14113 length:1545 start_codon:yes stop_codon:yes gene_type:complete